MLFSRCLSKWLPWGLTLFCSNREICSSFSLTFRFLHNSYEYLFALDLVRLLIISCLYFEFVCRCLQVGLLKKCLLIDLGANGNMCVRESVCLTRRRNPSLKQWAQGFISFLFPAFLLVCCTKLWLYVDS